MIGVIAHQHELEIVAEFFELFKTPWEFFQPDAHYNVLICTHEPFPEGAAEVIIFYSSQPTAFDARNELQVKAGKDGVTLFYAGKELPIYGKTGTFPMNRSFVLANKASGEPAGVFVQAEGKVLRIGYDLFHEIKHLLTVGQPPINARIPVIEWHIELLRELITGSGIPLVEIPPIPADHEFTACLTHDIDHPVIRNHRFDHTMMGFLWRATFTSLVDVCRGRKSIKDLGRNLAAVCKLPFVHLGVAKDFWKKFDRYLQIEAGLGATYFVIPKKDFPGRAPVGKDVGMRGARYEIADIRRQLQHVISKDGEIGLHGIDAWVSSTSALEEGQRITALTHKGDLGVRMHWLLFDEKSPAVLDQAGFLYDSTFGYNETVGFRPGTAQVYRPPGTAMLLELPLHIMDTALFYPSYLNYSDAQAVEKVSEILDDVVHFGGALTINWHDRSIAPERLWEGFYVRLIKELKDRGAWFATASQAVSWFEMRRSVRLDVRGEGEGGVMQVIASAPSDSKLPGMKVRIHKPRQGGLLESGTVRSATDCYDIPFKQSLNQTVHYSVTSNPIGETSLNRKGEAERTCLNQN